MQLEFAFLCDAATEAAGKLYALGIGVDRLHVRELPARHGRLTLVARVAFASSEEGVHPFELRFVDADGQHVSAPVGGELTVHVTDDAMGARVNLLIDVLNAEFRMHGPHELTLSIDASNLVVLPLDVALAPA